MIEIKERGKETGKGIVIEESNFNHPPRLKSSIPLMFELFIREGHISL